MKDESKFARELAQEIVALTDANKPERKRKIDWISIILCILGVAGAVVAVLSYFVRAETSPITTEFLLLKKDLTHLSSTTTDGFKDLNKKFDRMISGQAGVSPRHNDLMEERATLKQSRKDSN